MSSLARLRPEPPPDDAGPAPAHSDPAIASALRTVETERAGLDILHGALAGDLGRPFAAAVALAARTEGRWVVTGMGKSGHVGRKIASTLASTGTPAAFVHPAEASHGDLGMIRPEDVVLALSWSGETRELADILSHAKRHRVGLVALTANPRSALGQAADICLTLPAAREACPNVPAPTTSTTMMMAAGDAFAIALLEHRGFSASDFHVFHPGGRLGAVLKHVGSIMHAGERLPVVPSGTPMSEAIVVQSAKGFGCVIVAGPDGRLAGIVTDGDLRRHMGGNLLAMTVDAVMTPDPIAIGPDTLLGEAMEIAETRGISGLIVATDGRPVGIVRVLDLLRAGVA